MQQVSINYLAILLVVIVNMGIGMLWYSPMLFGKLWIKHMGLHMKNKEEMEKMKKEAGPAYIGMIITNLVMAYILSHFVDFVGATSVAAGAVTGFWLWLGFIATTSFANVLFEKKPLPLYFINTGFNLVSLLASGAILATLV